MNEELKQIECPAPCSFLVRSHDEKEVLDVCRRHAPEAHKMDVADAHLRKMLKPVRIEAGTKP